MISCAINSPEIIGLLYQDINVALKNAPKNQEFDHIDYMKNLFKDFSDMSSPEVAAKYLQSVPRLIILAKAMHFNSVKADLNALDKLNNDFTSKEGIATIIKDFGPTIDKSVKKASIKQKKELKNKIIQIPLGEVKVTEPNRFQTWGPFSGTMQSFLSINPNKKKDGKIHVEAIAPGKAYIVKTLSNISIAQGLNDPSEGVNYMGKRLMFKAYNLNTFATNKRINELDPETKEQIIRSRTFIADKKKDSPKLKQDSNIVEVDQRVILIVTDEGGNEIYFDKEGSITEADKGKIVYQFMRVVRKEDDVYTVRDVYDKENQVLSPEQIAKITYDKELDGDFDDYVKMIETNQQEQMSELYTVQEKALQNKTPLLPIISISNGVPSSLSATIISLKDLLKFPGITEDVYKTIKTASKATSTVEKGNATIVINGNIFGLQRPLITEDVALAIAQVLTNPKLTILEKQKFVNQFIPESITTKNRMHSINYFDAKGLLYFNIYNKQSFNDIDKDKSKTINLSPTTIEKKTPEELLAYQATIVQYLTKQGDVSNEGPVTMHYDNESLRERTYDSKFDDATGSFVKADYLDFLATLDADISIIGADPGFYNYVLNFVSPTTELGKSITKPTPIRDAKNAIVERLKAGEEITGVINQEYAKDTWDIFKPESLLPNGDKTRIVQFYNKTDRVLNESDKNQLVTLKLNPLNEAGYVDVVEVYLGNEYVGNVAETDYVKNEKEVPATVEEIMPVKPKAKAKSKTKTKIDIITKTTVPGAQDPANDFSDLDTSDLDRKGFKKEWISSKKVKEAEEWWNSDAIKPLRDLIKFDHAVNLVNSNVFATFIVNASRIVDADGKMATMKVNKANGTYFQNLTAYHESWHVFSQLFLTKSEKIALYTELQNYTDAKGNQPYSEMSFKELEEMLAEDFRNYVKTGKTKEKAPKRNSLFRKIVEFLKQLFGKNLSAFNKKDIEINSLNSPMASMLFNKLFIGEFNNYTPLIENAMLYELDRGIREVNNPTEDALSPTDSEFTVSSIDSYFAEILDDQYYRRKKAAELENKEVSLKSASIVSFTDPTKRAVLYKKTLEKFQEILKAEKLKIKKTEGSLDFNSLKTVATIKDNAVAIIKNKKGEDKYVFLTSQIENFDNLSPSFKQGERVKGENYQTIEIISDFYEHKTIKKNKKPIDIIIVSRLEDAEAQFQNYVKSKAKVFTSIELNPNAEAIAAENNISEGQELIKDNVRILEQIVRNWGDEKSGVVRYHIENSDYELSRLKSKDRTQENLDEEGDPIDEEEALFDSKTGKESLQQMMSKESKTIIKTLFKVVKENGEWVTPKNKFGFKERADSSKIFTILAKTIGGERNRDIAYEKLKVEAGRFPEIKQFFETKYPDPSKIKNIFEYSISKQFLFDFGKPRATYMQVFGFIDSDTNEHNFQVKESSLAIDNTINRWSAGVKSSGSTQFIKKSKNNVSSLKLSAIVKEFISNGELNINESVRFAKAIGIDMDSNKNISKALLEDPEYFGLQYIFDIVKGFEKIENLVISNPKEVTPEQLKYLNLFKENPVEILRDTIPSGILDTIAGSVKELTQLKRLAALQTKFGFDSATTGVIRANGNTAYQDMNWSTIAAMIDAVNEVEDIQELWTNPRYNFMGFLNPEINSHTRHLSMINNLFDLKGKKIPGARIVFQVVDGTSVVTKRKVQKDNGTTVEVSEANGNTTTELDPLSKFYQEFFGMTLGGVAELPRTSDKKMSYGIKIVGGRNSSANPRGTVSKGKDKNLYVDMAFFNTGAKGENYAVENHIFGYIQGEFDRIIKFRGPRREEFLTITGYNRVVDIVNGKEVYAGEIFTAFDSILLPETKKELYALADQQIDVDLIDYLRGNPLRKQIFKEVQSYFQEKTTEVNDLYFSKLNFIPKSIYEKLGYSAESLTRAKLIELRKDSNLSNNILKGYLYNDFIHKYETSMFLFGDHAQWDHAKESWAKRIPGSTSDGTGFLYDVNSNWIVNNVLNKETYASLLQKETGIKYDNFVMSETLNTAVIQDAVRDSIYLPDMIKSWEEEYAEAGYTKAQIKEFIKADKKAYIGMKEGDGMAYMTLDAYRTLHTIGNKGFTAAQESLYQKIINGETIDPKTVREYFPVYKLHEFGFIQNNLLPAIAMHKFAVVPLIPGVNAIEGSEFDKLHKMMLKQNVQYVTFGSGSKAVALTKDGKLDNIFADKSAKSINTKVDENDKDEFQFTLNPIFLANLKEVTIINQKFKKESTIATQTRGIVLDNLFKNGKIIDDKNEAPIAKYYKAVNDYTNILKEQLLNEIGFELVDGRFVGNITQFVEIIRNELSNRDVPQHLIKLINTTEDKSLAMDLSIHPEAEVIEKLLMSFIQRGLIKQKTNGEPLTQTPSIFTNGIWDTEYTLITDLEEIKKLLGTNTLPFYVRNRKGRSTEMKVAIALQGDYINLLNAKDLEGETIGTIDRLNQLIKDPVWFEKNREALTMFGPRIPNDATSTIEAATIWHFLPTAYGNSIILPTEIVAKAGSDYDGDKLFMLMSNIDKEGNVINKGIDNFDEVLKETVILEKEGKLPEGQMSSSKLIDYQKKFLQNEYKNAAVEILMLPENYAYLTKPNGTYLVDKYVEELEAGRKGYNRFKNPLGQPSNLSAPDENGNRKTERSPTRDFEIVHNLYVHDANLSLEPSLGLMAKLTKGHVIYKIEGAKMPSTYRAAIFNKTLGKSMESGIRLPVVMRFKKNTTTNEAGETVISLSGDRTQKGTRISDVLSHGLQGILDRGTDPFPFVLELTPEAMDLFSYLIQSGVNEEEIFYLQNQPYVKQYFDAQKLRNSAFYNTIKPQDGSAINDVVKSMTDNLGKEKLEELANKVNILKLNSTIEQLKAFGLDKSYAVSIKGFASEMVPLSELVTKLADGTLEPLEIGSIAKTIKNLKEGNSIYFYNKNLSSAQNYAFSAQILSDQYLGKGKNIDLSLLKRGFKGNLSTGEQLAVFMNVVELEKQWAKMKELSQLFTPDTSKLGTVQQVIKRKEMYENLKKVSGIDQAFLKRLLEDSILSSFNQDDLILDLIVPFFRLRLDPVITDYIGELFADPEKSALIRAKFKKGIDGQERFTTVFNNAVVNFIYQNDMSNFVEDGKFVNFPKVYEGLNISVNDESPYAAIAEEGKLILNTRQIESEYANKKYLTTSTTEDSNINTGLDVFTLKQDPFNTLESYYRYVIARETLRFNTTEETLEGNKYFERKVKELDDVNMAYESYISEKALAESFNFNYIMGKTKYSYTQTVLDTINEFTTEDFNIKDAYPILAQLAPAPNKEGLKLLQLNNKKEAQGTLASSYYLDIRKLADPSIMKVANRADNNRISEVFSSFSLMMYYQHGLGKTTLGFVKALDPSRYKNIMTTAVENFMADELREYVLDDIFATVMTDARFKNHLLNSQDYIHEDIAQEEQDRILPTETIEEVYPEGEANEVTLIPGKRIVFEEDVNAFKAVLAQLGRKPDVWFTSKTTFSEFYNSNTGKREGMPQSAQWVKNSRELYDMIDKDPEMEGVIYYENVDLATGLQMVEKDAPVSKVEPVSTGKVIEGKPVFSSLPEKSTTPTMLYAGIGSRETPKEVLDVMPQVAKYLESLGYTLRSGGAAGADAAFEKGVTSKKEIFLGNVKTGERELKIAEEIHPAWNVMLDSTRKKAIAKGNDPERSASFVANLMARNTNQIFGKNLDTPVDFVLFYAKETSDPLRPAGGTGQAVEMARRKGIPTINMADTNWRDQLKTAIATQPSTSVDKVTYYQFEANKPYQEIGNINRLTPLTKDVFERFKDKFNINNYDEFIVKTKEIQANESSDDIQMGSGFPTIDEVSQDNGKTWKLSMVRGSKFLDDYYQSRIDKGWAKKITFNELTQSSTSVKSVDSEKSSTIATDIEVFNKLVSDNNGELPESFMVDDVRLWKIYKNGNYNLVDKDTGAIYMRNVNMETGKAEVESELTELITDELRQTAIDEFLNLLELPGMVEKFAELDHDTNDILNNLAKAKTRKEYNDVMKIIDELC